MGYKQEVRKKINATSRETRQKILDLVHQSLCVGDIGKELNISTDIIGQVILDNIVITRTLSTEAK